LAERGLAASAQVSADCRSTADSASVVEFEWEELDVLMMDFPADPVEDAGAASCRTPLGALESVKDNEF